MIERCVIDYFENFTKEALNYRKENAIKRNDFLQTVINLRDEENEVVNSGLTDEVKSRNERFDSKHNPGEKVFEKDCIPSIIFNFLFSGLKPSEVTINFALFEIARNRTIQSKLQDEIDSVVEKHKGWNYESIKDMIYLNQIIQETLRLHTNTPMIVRSVSEPYELPESGLTLEKGMLIIIPHSAFHLDPKFYPSPGVFNPDRFVGNNFKSSSTFLPFGNGPRMCISVKFAVMMMKVILARILFRFDVKVGDKMQMPLTFDRDDTWRAAKGGIWQTFSERVKK